MGNDLLRRCIVYPCGHEAGSGYRHSKPIRPAIQSYAAMHNCFRMPNQGFDMKGSCLCGSITYEVDQLDYPIQHCSCRTCRKAHAAAFNTTAGVLNEHFHWLAGEERLSSYESSPGKRRYFCSNCGSQLVAERLGNPHLVVRVATLDEDPNVRPGGHIWTSHEVPWLEFGPQIPAYPEWGPAGS